MSGRFNTFLTCRDLRRARFCDFRRALPLAVGPRRAGLTPSWPPFGSPKPFQKPFKNQSFFRSMFSYILAPFLSQNASQNHIKSIKNRSKTKVEFRYRFYCVFKPAFTKKSTLEIQKTLSLYWYLQCFAALGLFALIRVWVMIFMKIQAMLPPNIDKNPIKKRSKTVLIYWSSVELFFMGFWLHFNTFPVPILAPKSLKR